MHGCFFDNGATSAPFTIANGTKQGCVLAPLLISIHLSMMLLVAFKDCDLGVPILIWIDGSIFNLRQLQACTKVFAAVIRDLLFADDCTSCTLPGRSTAAFRPICRPQPIGLDSPSE
jgi:hypothetical protein